jgi:type I site-specific restriction endonuclease
MAYELAEFMRAGGIRAEALDGGTGKTDRREIFARYESGETQVLCNVLVLSTGWDSPITECLVMARPTQSKALYLQAMGRGLRTLPRVIDGLETAEERLAAIAASAKPSCLVMDMIGVTGRHKLMTLVDLMGVGKPKARRKLTELVEDAEQEKREAAEREERERIEAELEARRVKLIESATAPARPKRDLFTWQTDFFTNRETLYVRDVTIQVRQMADGQSWIASDNKQQFRFVNGSAETCKKAAEEYATKLFFGNEQAAWRKKPASEKQLGMLRKFRIPVKEGLTAGEASDIISKVFEKKKERVSA